VAVLDERRVVSGSRDCSIRIWDFTTGACLKEIAGHAEGVKALAVLPNGTIASGSYDKTIRVWSPVSGQCLKELSGHEEVPSSSSCPLLSCLRM
jgi:WD40 repeat protein